MCMCACVFMCERALKPVSPESENVTWVFWFCDTMWYLQWPKYCLWCKQQGKGKQTVDKRARQEQTGKGDTEGRQRWCCGYSKCLPDSRTTAAQSLLPLAPLLLSLPPLSSLCSLGSYKLAPCCWISSLRSPGKEGGKGTQMEGKVTAAVTVRQQHLKRELLPSVDSGQSWRWRWRWPLPTIFHSDIFRPGSQEREREFCVLFQFWVIFSIIWVHIFSKAEFGQGILCHLMLCCDCWIWIL